MDFTSLFLYTSQPRYVSPYKICRLVSMLSVTGLPRGCGGCGGFPWGSRFFPGHQPDEQFLLRCPTSACVDGAPWHLSTAATRSGRSSRHRRRSHRSPVAFIYLSPFLVGTPLLRCPYNNFTNNDAIICKCEEIILPGLLFAFTML